MHTEKKAMRHASAIWKTFLVQQGLKASRQRDVIADVFFAYRDHVSIEDLLQRVRRIDPKISQATVYRTIKLLVACCLARVHHFLNGQTRYELSIDEDPHHDHLICTHCGKIVEFLDDRIESLQEAVAKKHQFTVLHHRMELYGLCQVCQEKNR